MPISGLKTHSLSGLDVRGRPNWIGSTPWSRQRTHRRIDGATKRPEADTTLAGGVSQQTGIKIQINRPERL